MTLPQSVVGDWRLPDHQFLASFRLPREGDRIDPSLRCTPCRGRPACTWTQRPTSITLRGALCLAASRRCSRAMAPRLARSGWQKTCWRRRAGRNGGRSTRWREARLRLRIPSLRCGPGTARCRGRGGNCCIFRLTSCAREGLSMSPGARSSARSCRLGGSGVAGPAAVPVRGLAVPRWPPGHRPGRPAAERRGLHLSLGLEAGPGSRT